MQWALLKIGAEALTSFLLFHEFLRLSTVIRLCRRHDIKSTGSFALSLCTISLSMIFMVFFMIDLGYLFSGANHLPPVVGDRANNSVTREAFVEKVLNGDTIRISGGETVVYKGIDAPEFPRGSGWMGESSAAATALNRKLVEGKQVVLELDPFQRDRYQRIPAYVYVNGVLVNAELVRRGMAMANDYSAEDGGQGRRFARLQQQAIKLRLGIWKHALSSRESQMAPVVGNRRSKIYHLPSGRYYHIVSPKNRVFFSDEEEARMAGYRRSKS
jgi:micrococcal nuclease